MATITSTTTPNAAYPTSPTSVAICSFARPADTTAYAVGDVISDSTSTARCLVFDAGMSGEIMHAHVGYEETKTADLELWLFDAEPTNHLDNAALALVAADLPKIICRYSLRDSSKVTVGSGMDWREAFDANGGLVSHPRPFASATGKLYGLLVTRTVYTPASAKVFHVKLGLHKT